VNEHPIATKPPKTFMMVSSLKPQHPLLPSILDA
jgi:hypothetical protein